MWVTLDSRVMGWRRGQKGLNLAFPFPYSFLLFLLDRCFLIQALLCVRYHALSWGYSDEWRRRWCWFLGIYSLVREGQSSMAVEQTAPTGWVVRVRISSPPSLLGQAFRSDSEGQPGSAPEYLRPHLGTRWAVCPGPLLRQWLGSLAFLYVALSGVDTFEMAPSLTYLEPRLNGWLEEMRMVGCLFSLCSP